MASDGVPQRSCQYILFNLVNIKRNRDELIPLKDTI